MNLTKFYYIDDNEVFENDGEEDLFEKDDIENFLEAIKNKESTFYIQWSEGFSYTVKLCYFDKDEAYKQLTFSLKRSIKDLTQQIQKFKTAMKELL